MHDFSTRRNWAIELFVGPTMSTDVSRDFLNTGWQNTILIWWPLVARPLDALFVQSRLPFSISSFSLLTSEIRTLRRFSRILSAESCGTA